ncbi:MAG: hypothetical protein QOK48_2902 [Blastocatellia bacterium]|nr:hypothetical protein [Blastocatellia bacterium]
MAVTGTPGVSNSLLLAMAFFTGCMVTGMQNGINAGAGLIYPTALLIDLRNVLNKAIPDNLPDEGMTATAGGGPKPH